MLQAGDIRKPLIIKNNDGKTNAGQIVRTPTIHIHIQTQLKSGRKKKRRLPFYTPSLTVTRLTTTCQRHRFLIPQLETRSSIKLYFQITPKPRAVQEPSQPNPPPRGANTHTHQNPNILRTHWCCTVYTDHRELWISWQICPPSLVRLGVGFMG